uniref:Uncharacterized protein n=1 Tax=Glossina austeni TaxID=7395 RepID=A0A1A9VLT2_GLOAU
MYSQSKQHERDIGFECGMRAKIFERFERFIPTAQYFLANLLRIFLIMARVVIDLTISADWISLSMAGCHVLSSFFVLKNLELGFVVISFYSQPANKHFKVKRFYHHFRNNNNKKKKKIGKLNSYPSKYNILMLSMIQRRDAQITREKKAEVKGIHRIHVVIEFAKCNMLLLV